MNIPEEEFTCAIGNHDCKSQLYVRVNDNVTLCMLHTFEIQDAFKKIESRSPISEHRIRHEWRKSEELEREVAAIERMRREAVNQPGFVYYARIGDRIKIGYTADVKTRMRSYPAGTELLAVQPGTRTAEAELHRQFRGSLVEGREWFRDGTALRRHITRVREQFGDPSDLMYRRRKAG